MVKSAAEIKSPNLSDSSLVEHLRTLGIDAFDDMGNIKVLGNGFAGHTGGAVVLGLRKRLVESELYEDAAVVSEILREYSEKFPGFDEKADWEDEVALRRMDVVRAYHEAVLHMWTCGFSSIDSNGLVDGEFGLDLIRKGMSIFGNLGMYKTAARLREWADAYVEKFGSEPRGGRMFSLDPGDFPEDMIAIKNQ
jgi:hypothetical protein